MTKAKAKDIDEGALIDSYFSLRETIFALFGYVEDWKAIPMEDNRDQYWQLEQSAEGHGHVRYHEAKEVVLDAQGEGYYEDEIYTQRHLPRWVYRSGKFTMVCCNPHVDGNHFLRIFDNEKEVKV